MITKLDLGLLKFQKVFKEKESLFQNLKNVQIPGVWFITCSDSRIDPNLVTQTQPGDLFITRNIGNIIPPDDNLASSSEAAAVEFVLNDLKVKNIIVCGHSDCGAMKGLLKKDLQESRPKVASWIKHAAPAQEGLDEHLDPIKKLEEVTKRNVLLQIEHLKSYPIIAEKIAAKELTIQGWVYKIDSGEIFVHDEEKNTFLSFNEAIKAAIEEKKNRIIKEALSNYLKPLLSPTTESEFQETMQLLASLKIDLSTIWPHLKPVVGQMLWEEIGGLYKSFQDNEFQGVLESMAAMKLESLSELGLEQPLGYYKFCSTQTWFGTLSEANPKTIKSQNCTNPVTPPKLG